MKINLSENYGADYFEDEIDDEVIDSAIDKHLENYSEGDYTYSITYSTWGEDDLEIGDTDDRGFEVQDEPADEDDIRRVIRDYGFSYEDGTDWLVTLDLDTDYKTGKVTDYSMHIKKNGVELTGEEYSQLTQPAVEDDYEDLGDDLDDAGIYSDDSKPIPKPTSITEANYNYTGFNRYPKEKIGDSEYPKYGRFNFEEIVDTYIETLADEYETEYMPSINYDSGSEEEIEAEEAVQDEFRNKIKEAKRAAFNAVRHQVDQYEAELAKEIDTVFARAFDLEGGNSDRIPMQKPMSITEGNNYTGFNRYPKMKSGDTEYPKYGRFNFEEIVDTYIETLADEYETEYMPSINYYSGSEEEIEAEEAIQDEFRNKIAETKKAAFNAVRHQVDEYEAELAKEIDTVFARAFDLPTAVSESKLVKEADETNQQQQLTQTSTEKSKSYMVGFMFEYPATKNEDATKLLQKILSKNNITVGIAKDSGNDPIKFGQSLMKYQPNFVATPELINSQKNNAGLVKCISAKLNTSYVEWTKLSTQEFAGLLNEFIKSSGILGQAVVLGLLDSTGTKIVNESRTKKKLLKEEIFKPEMDLNPDVFPFTVGTKVNTPFGAGVVVGHDDADKSKRSTYPMSFPTKFSTYGVRPFVKLEDPSKIQPESVRKLYDQNGRLPFYRKELTKV